MTEALRDAILNDPRSFAEVSRQTGLTRQSLMNFAAKKHSLRLDLADKLAVFYGMEIVQKKESN